MVEHNNRTWKIKTRKKSGQDYQNDDDKKPFGNIIYHMIQLYARQYHAIH